MIAVDVITGVLVLVAVGTMVLLAWIGVLGVLGAVRLQRCRVCGQLTVTGRGASALGGGDGAGGPGGSRRPAVGAGVVPSTHLLHPWAHHLPASGRHSHLHRGQHRHHGGLAA